MREGRQKTKVKRQSKGCLYQLASESDEGSLLGAELGKLAWMVTLGGNRGYVIAIGGGTLAQSSAVVVLDLQFLVWRGV